ncbi:MAG: hypothetical protein IJX62_05725 [Clostridia bacterium]|nr:hypothetical protein [Clostridia bacterium]
MGFGYLLIGYLVTFVLHVTTQALGLGPLGLLVGYGVMYMGLSKLNPFQRAFSIARWTLIPLTCVSLCHLAVAFADVFLLDLPFRAPILLAVEWSNFALLIFFNMSMLYGIRMIARDVELPRIATAAVRNTLFVGAYAILYLLGQSPALEPYLVLPAVLTQIVWVACNLFLILTCAKDICPEGEEEITPKRYRWEFLNKIGDAYERTRQRSIDRTTREAEEAIRRRNERLAQKKSMGGQKSKHKKKE